MEHMLAPIWSFEPVPLVTVLLVGLSVLFAWRRYLSPISDIPGPVFASFTRLWHIRHIFIGDQNLQLLDLHENNGHFVRIAHDEVSVSHPDGVKKLLLATIPKGYWYAGLALPDYRYMAPMTITQPKAKVALSKALSPGYSLSNVLQAEHVMGKTIEGLLGWMDRYAESGEPMHLDQYLTYTAFDVVGEVIFSRPFGFLKQGIDVEGSIANSKLLTMMAAFTPYMRHLRNILLTNPIMTDLQVLPMGHVFNTAKRAVDARRSDPDARFDIVAHWFKTHAEDPSRLTLRNIYAQATNNVGAGADTVSCALQSFIYHGIRHPHVWRRLQEEVDGAIRAGELSSTDKVVSFVEAQKLPYLQACIKEALRFFNPVPMGLPRCAPAGGVTIGDRTFPQGTILSVNPWVVHLSEEIWGPDARIFNPNRWFRADAAELEKRNFIPFGAGYNSCPGHHVAKMELSKITATIVRDYNVRQVTPQQEWQWAAYFTVVPHDWPVHLERRKRM